MNGKPLTVGHITVLNEDRLPRAVEARRVLRDMKAAEDRGREQGRREMAREIAERVLRAASRYTPDYLGFGSCLSDLKSDLETYATTGCWPEEPRNE